MLSLASKNDLENVILDRSCTTEGIDKQQLRWGQEPAVLGGVCSQGIMPFYFIKKEIGLFSVPSTSDTHPKGQGDFRTQRISVL